MAVNSSDIAAKLFALSSILKELFFKLFIILPIESTVLDRAFAICPISSLSFCILESMLLVKSPVDTTFKLSFIDISLRDICVEINHIQTKAIPIPKIDTTIIFLVISDTSFKISFLGAYMAKDQPVLFTGL